MVQTFAALGRKAQDRTSRWYYYLFTTKGLMYLRKCVRLQCCISCINREAWFGKPENLCNNQPNGTASHTCIGYPNAQSARYFDALEHQREVELVIQERSERMPIASNWTSSRCKVRRLGRPTNENSVLQRPPRFRPSFVDDDIHDLWSQRKQCNSAWTRLKWASPKGCLESPCINYLHMNVYLDELVES
jgi:hypothetical protein